MDTIAPAVPVPEVPEVPTVKKVFVANLNYKVRDEDLTALFSKFGTLVTCEVQMLNETMSRGFALVEFENEEIAQAAIDALNGTELMDRPMNVRFELDRNDRPTRTRDVNRQQNNNSNNNNQNANRVERAPPADTAAGPRAERGATTPYRRRLPSYGKQLFIGNLHYRTSWQDLKDEFRKVGEVVRADVFTTEVEGMKRSKGCGIIVMSSEEEAQKAVEELNGAVLRDRKILVRLDVPPADRPQYSPGEEEEAEQEEQEE